MGLALPWHRTTARLAALFWDRHRNQRRVDVRARTYPLPMMNIASPRQRYQILQELLDELTA